jgi:hypothetical protein
MAFQSLGGQQPGDIDEIRPLSCHAPPLALLLVAPGPGAQTRGQSPQEITVDVPFDFMVEHVMFIAGTYTVRPLGNRTFQRQVA